MTRCFRLIVIIALLGVASFAADPASSAREVVGWRRDGSGQYPSADPPTKWSSDRGILWRAQVGTGTASPIAVAGRVFVASEPDLLICLDAQSGKELWRKAHKIADFPAAANPKNPLRPGDYGNANPTPVSDGTRVWAIFGTGIVACYDMAGHSQWINWQDVPQTTDYARTASPLLVGDRLLVHFGPLLCLDAATGKLLWQNDDATASYGTPVHTRIGDVDIVITPAGHAVRIVDGATLASDLGRCAYTSPIVQGHTVYFPDTSISAVRLPESAAGVFRTKELWYNDLSGEFFASAILHEGRIHVVNRDADHYIIDAATGRTLEHKTLELPPAGNAQSPNIYPSLCLAGKYLFVGNDAGEWLLMEAKEKGATLSINALPEGCGASPAFDGQRMFLRGAQMLFCIGPEK